MGIKLSAAPEDQAISATDKLRAGFVLALGGMITALRRVILPHLLLALAFFSIFTYALYKIGPNTWPLPPIFTQICLILLLGAISILAMLYAGATSTLYALKMAATYAEEFFYELLEALKDKVRAKINNLDEGIAKQQAKVILDNSVREVISPLQKLRFRSAPAILGQVLLALLTFVSRSVFLARIARATGATVHFSAIFASRATLIGALFLNMRWLATLLLWLFYALGGILVLISIGLVW